MRLKRIMIVVSVLLVFLALYVFHLITVQKQYLKLKEVVHKTLDHEQERLLKKYAKEPQLSGGTTYSTEYIGDLFSNWLSNDSFSINYSNQTLGNNIIISGSVLTELTWNGPIRECKLHVVNIIGIETESFITALEEATGYQADRYDGRSKR